VGAGAGGDGNVGRGGAAGEGQDGRGEGETVGAPERDSPHGGRYGARIGPCGSSSPTMRGKGSFRKGILPASWSIATNFEKDVVNGIRNQTRAEPARRHTLQVCALQEMEISIAVHLLDA
jgi:hypothetical protein